MALATILSTHKHLIFAANPNYYDYIHEVELNVDGTCRMMDGGGQTVNLVLTGNYTDDGETITFSNLESEDGTIYKDVVRSVKYKVKTYQDYTKVFFNGYVKMAFTYGITFDDTPFPIQELTESRKGTLFYAVENVNPFPLQFYADCKYIPCDTQRERIIESIAHVRIGYQINTLSKMNLSPDEEEQLIQRNMYNINNTLEFYPGLYYVSENMYVQYTNSVFTFTCFTHIERSDDSLVTRQDEVRCYTKLTDLQQYLEDIHEVIFTLH
jgi:hypothetical protein